METKNIINNQRKGQQGQHVKERKVGRLKICQKKCDKRATNRREVTGKEVIKKRGQE